MIKNLLTDPAYHITMLLSLAALNALDWATTYFIISNGGVEANPILLYLINHFETVDVVWYIKFILIIVLSFYAAGVMWSQELREKGTTVFIGSLLAVANALYIHVVYHNITIIHIII